MTATNSPSDNITAVDRVRAVTLQSVTDDRGSLCIVDGTRQIEFPIKRVYWLYGVPPGAERAGHAHRALYQCYIAASGSVRVRLDDAFKRREVVLNRPNEGLVIGPGVWRELCDFAPHTVMLVLASAEFDENDYVRDYMAFQHEHQRLAP